jgi:HPt (histidine-containing phosphotransfer) domain-containing protein
VPPRAITGNRAGSDQGIRLAPASGVATEHAHSESRSAKATGDDSILDAAILDDLASLDETLVADVVQSFRADVPVRIAALRMQISAEDAQGVARAAHGLKGSALAVGAVALRDVCVAIERAAQSGDLDAIQQHTTELDPAFHRVSAALEAWL